MVDQPISKSIARSTCLAYLDRLDHAWNEWGPCIDEWDVIHKKNSIPDTDLPMNSQSEAAWLESLDAAYKRDAAIDGGFANPAKPEDRWTIADLESQASLRRCTWCRAPSVVLRKCKGECPAR